MPAYLQQYRASVEDTRRNDVSCCLRLTAYSDQFKAALRNSFTPFSSMWKMLQMPW